MTSAQVQTPHIPERQSLLLFLIRPQLHQLSPPFPLPPHSSASYKVDGVEGYKAVSPESEEQGPLLNSPYALLETTAC